MARNSGLNRDQACVSQKTRKLYGPVKFSGCFSGEVFGLRKVFLKTPERNPIFSGRFFGNILLRLREFICSRMNANSRRVELVIIFVDLLNNSRLW